jgi:hypothetical protein
MTSHKQTYLADLCKNKFMMLASQKAHGQEEEYRVPGAAYGLINYDLGDGVGNV